MVGRAGDLEEQEQEQEQEQEEHVDDAVTLFVATVAAALEPHWSIADITLHMRAVVVFHWPILIGFVVVGVAAELWCSSGSDSTASSLASDSSGRWWLAACGSAGSAASLCNALALVLFEADVAKAAVSAGSEMDGPRHVRLPPAHAARRRTGRQLASVLLGVPTASSPASDASARATRPPLRVAPPGPRPRRLPLRSSVCPRLRAAGPPPVPPRTLSP